VIAPGAGRPAAPGVTAEAVEPQYGWAAALLRLAIAREPSFMVDVSWPRNPGTADHNAAVVRISRTPGDRVVASGSFTGNEDELVGIIGCFCITFLRRQPRLRQRTPRWERWSQDPNGYRAYRDGLQNQRQGINTRSLAEEEKARHYEKALHYFDEAARIEPANLLVQLHRAALLELTDQNDRAADIYTMCNALWPEHIETGYRLGNARKNAPDHVSHAELINHLEGLRARLEVHNLVKLWLRTFRPGRWNPGERHYWQSWMELWLPGRLTKRASYLQAIAIAELLAELSCMLSVGSGCPCGGEGRSLMTKLANQLLKPARTPPVTRLLYPERIELRAPEHDHSWHQATAYNGLQASIYRSGGRRRDLDGWRYSMWPAFSRSPSSWHLGRYRTRSPPKSGQMTARVPQYVRLASLSASHGTSLNRIGWPQTRISRRSGAAQRVWHGRASSG
jgi:tetratricopeptide (TPR) repeat protein